MIKIFFENGFNLNFSELFETIKNFIFSILFKIFKIIFEIPKPIQYIIIISIVLLSVFLCIKAWKKRNEWRHRLIY
jgi:hypothetical protein